MILSTLRELTKIITITEKISGHLVEINEVIHSYNNNPPPMKPTQPMPSNEKIHILDHFLNLAALTAVVAAAQLLLGTLGFNV